MDGDNNIEAALIDDFLEMAAVGSDSRVNIVVPLDRIAGYSSLYENWTDARRGLIRLNDTPTASWGTSRGELNMGDPQTLSDFVIWAMRNFPAARYALVLSDHGSGWRARAAAPSRWPTTARRSSSSTAAAIRSR